MWQRTIECLGVSVSVTCTLPEIEPTLSGLLHTYADTSEPAVLAFRLERGSVAQLVRDGEIVYSSDHLIDLVPGFELQLYTQVIARARGLAIHAGAVVGANGGALVFAGQSGAGKSTLVRALVARGFRYLTEECVDLRANQRCAGLARSLHIDSDDVALPEGFTSSSYAIEGYLDHADLATREARGMPTSHRKTLKLFHPPESCVWRGETRTAAVLVISHADDASPARSALNTGSLLHALWPMVFRQHERSISDAALGLADVPCYRLHTATAAQCLDRTLALAEELGISPRD